MDSLGHGVAGVNRLKQVSSARQEDSTRHSTPSLRVGGRWSWAAWGVSASRSRTNRNEALSPFGLDSSPGVLGIPPATAHTTPFHNSPWPSTVHPDHTRATEPYTHYPPLSRQSEAREGQTLAWGLPPMGGMASGVPPTPAPSRPTAGRSGATVSVLGLGI